MKALYYFKWPLLLFLSGYIVQVSGAFLKIRHWPGADEIFLLITCMIISATIYAIIKIAVLKKQD